MEQLAMVFLISVNSSVYMILYQRIDQHIRYYKCNMQLEYLEITAAWAKLLHKNTALSIKDGLPCHKENNLK